MSLPIVKVKFIIPFYNKIVRSHWQRDETFSIFFFLVKGDSINEKTFARQLKFTIAVVPIDHNTIQAVERILYNGSIEVTFLYIETKIHSSYYTRYTGCNKQGQKNHSILRPNQYENFLLILNVRFLSELQDRELGEIFRFSFSWIFSTYLSVCNTSDIIPNLTSDRYLLVSYWYQCSDISRIEDKGNARCSYPNFSLKYLYFLRFLFFFSVIVNFFQL